MLDVLSSLSRRPPGDVTGTADMPAPEPIGDEAEPSSQPDDAAAEDGEATGPDRKNAERLIRWADPKTINIAKEIVDNEDGTWVNGKDLLGAIGQRVIREYDIDLQSRKSWEDRTKKAMDLAMQVTQPKSTPWEGASNVIYPLISTAAIQFSARAYPAIVAGEDVVKGVVYGDDDGIPLMDEQTGEQAKNPKGEPMWVPDKSGAPQKPGFKRDRADRIGQHMSYQLLGEQPEWDEETDRLLVILPIVGCVFRKSFFDPSMAMNRAILVRAEDLIINYRAKSVDTAPRKTERLRLYPFEIEENVRLGVFLKGNYGTAVDGGLDEDAPHLFLEQHRRLDLDSDGYPEPYIVTVHKDTGHVCRIRAGFDAENVHFSGATHEIAKIEAVEYYTKYDFLPNPDGGIYGVGFGDLLNPINDSINTTLNMIFDAGTLQNSGGGFVGKGLGMRGGQVKFKPGEYKIVNAIGSTIKDSVVALTFPGPSDVLFKLLGLLIEAGKEVSSNTEVLAGNQTKANVPATTTLALIEQGLKVFTGVYKRVHRSLKSEYAKQYRLNRIYLNDEASYQRGDSWKKITREDYLEGAGVLPVSDPSMVTDMQQLARAEFLQGFKDDPLFDNVEVRRRMLQAAKVQEIEKLLTPNPETNPLMQIKIQEMKDKSIVSRAISLFHMARGIQALALADKAVGDVHLQWLDLNFKMLQDEMDRLVEPSAPPGQPGPPEPLLQPPPLPPGGDPPGVGGKVNLSAGLGGG